MQFLLILSFLVLSSSPSSWAYSPLTKIDNSIRRTVEPLDRTCLSSRRAFLGSSASASGSAVMVAFGSAPANAIDLKVTPIAHTFVTTPESAKPTRENDATRFLTNAKVVYLCEGQPSGLINTVIDLTTKRKEGKGPGVTPGNIVVATPSQDLATSVSGSLGVATKVLSASPEAVATLAATLPEGDTLLVGPIPSTGTAGDGKVVAETAKKLGVSVGGAKSGGVISVLLDGPVKDVKLEEQGYPISTILWYGV